MSLPRADYDPRRVCMNPCPNFTLGLGKQKRTVGVYLAGALVCPFRSTNGFRTRNSSHVSLGSLSPLAEWILLTVILRDCGRSCVRVCLGSRGRTSFVVHPRQLDVPRRRDPLRARPTPTRDGTCVGACHFRRLDPRNLLSPRHARRQLDRQGPGSWG